MTGQLPAHIQGLVAYLSQPSEKANEDLALAYFRTMFGADFTRQREAKRADGYVPGSFVLELKGESRDWLSGLFQGLAYKNSDLDFAQIVVAAKSFLAVWQVSSIPVPIRMELSAENGAPNAIGRKYARRYAARKNKLLKLASWDGADLFTPLFLAQPDIVLSRIDAFGRTLKEGEKVRQKITLANFPTVLREMTPFFDPAKPILSGSCVLQYALCMDRKVHGANQRQGAGSSDLRRRNNYEFNTREANSI